MRYISDSVISFSLPIKGQERSARISFSPVSTGGSTYVTDSEAVIKAMEESTMYGVIYRRAPESVGEVVSKRKKVTKVLEPKVEEVTEVSGWQDAVEYLSEKFGIEPSKLTNPDSILSEAASRNIKFVNLQ